MGAAVAVDSPGSFPWSLERVGQAFISPCCVHNEIGWKRKLHLPDRILQVVNKHPKQSCSHWGPQTEEEGQVSCLPDPYSTFSTLTAILGLVAGGLEKTCLHDMQEKVLDTIVY